MEIHRHPLFGAITLAALLNHAPVAHEIAAEAFERSNEPVSLGDQLNDERFSLSCKPLYTDPLGA